jgi:hypothetical protein
VLTLDPHNPIVLYQRGTVYLGIGNVAAGTADISEGPLSPVLQKRSPVSDNELRRAGPHITVLGHTRTVCKWR